MLYLPIAMKLTHPLEFPAEDRGCEGFHYVGEHPFSYTKVCS